MKSLRGSEWASWILPAALGTIGIAAIVLWITSPDPAIPVRVPGADRPPGAQTEMTLTGDGILTRGDGRPSTIQAAWPRFRGSNGDGVGTASVPLLDALDTSLPAKTLWDIPVGEGYAGPAVFGGCVYLMDYDREIQSDVIRCLSLADGRDIWRYSYRSVVKRNHGMSRTVPAVDDKYVVALGPKCQVTCLSRTDGGRLWSKDLVREFGTIVPPWYAGQCPLIDGDDVILAPAGPAALMIAVNCATGTIRWQTPNPHGWKMTHSSVLPLLLNGRRYYVYAASGGIVVVQALDGAIVWSSDEWKINIANVPTPVLVPPDRLLFTGGYNAGCILFQIEVENAKVTLKPLFRKTANVFGSDQQTPVSYDGFIYGVRPGGELTCMDFNGVIRWTSKKVKFGLGPYIVADNKLLVMNDSGLLTMVRAAPDAFQSLGQAQVLNGHDSWGPLALVDGLLLCRDLNRLVCIDIRRQ